MPRRRLAPLLLALGLAACGERGGGAASDAAPDKPSPPTTDLEVPVGRPVAMDGRVLPGEWEDALQRPLGTHGGALRLMQHRGTLLLGVTLPGGWAPRGRLWLLWAPDAEGSGWESPGAFRIDFEPREHDRAHLLAWRAAAEGPVRVAEGAVARAHGEERGASVEVAVPLRLLGLGPDAAPPLRFAAVQFQRPGTPALTWPPGLDLTGPPGGPPADLASTRRWGRLAGWRDVDGPGAISRTEWEALLAHDREIASRGGAAHALGLRIAEDPQLAKADGEQEPVLFGNLGWIAEHEPLTATDLMLLARGHRFLNRSGEALAVLDVLAGHPEARDGESLLYLRARTLETAERFAEAAAVWDRLAERVAPGAAGHYAGAARRARRLQAAWEAEREAREQDRARSDLPLVLLRTNRGDVLVQLFGEDVPMAVDHFLALVEAREGDRGFYEGTLFHRVVGAFLAQGGDPTSRDVNCESAGSADGPSTIPPEVNARHGFFRGSVGFAQGPAGRNGCQFFILVAARPELGDRGFTCFGHVIAGMDAVDRLEQCDVLREVRRLDAAGGTR